MTNFGDFRLTVFGQFNPTLTMVAARHGDIDFAMKYVNELPSIYCGREIVAEQVLNGLNFEQAIVKYLKDNS